MINDGMFRILVEKIIDNPDDYSKDDIYIAFLEMTERYLIEMITTSSLEKALTEGMDEEDAAECIEEAMSSNPDVRELDWTNAQEPDIRLIIKNLMDFIENDMGINIE